MPSIADLKRQLDEPKSQTQMESTKMSNDEFTEVDLRLAWDNYVRDEIEKKNRINLLVTLKESAWRVEGKNIILSLENEVQKEQVQSEKEALMQYIRKAVNNFSVMIEIELVEVEASKKLYTDSQKLEYLTETYPMVRLLREKFRLGTDF